MIKYDEIDDMTKNSTTVLLLLVKFCRNDEYQHHMKKHWALKI